MPSSTIRILTFCIVTVRSVASARTFIPCVLLPSNTVSFNPLSLAFSGIPLPVHHWLGFFAIALCTSMVRIPTSRSFAFCVAVPRNWCVLCTSLIRVVAVIVASLVVGRDRTNNATQFFYRGSAGHKAKVAICSVPMSSTLPPLLVSSPRGALHVGQYCASNSLMYS